MWQPLQAETQYGQIAARTKSDFVFYFHSHLETCRIILVKWVQGSMLLVNGRRGIIQIHDCIMQMEARATTNVDR